MRFEKKILESDFTRCYAVASFAARGETRVFFATEGEGACVAFSGPELGSREVVWEQPGGCMGMVPVPGRPGDFLAVQRFFKLFQWDEACLVWVEAKAGGGWEVHPLVTLPYLHRFDILHGADGRAHLVVCQLSTAKETREDWSNAGVIHTALLPDDWNGELRLTPLKTDLFQNHGYCRVTVDGRERGLITGREGVFLATPPTGEGDAWTLEKILDEAVSDAAFADIDGDGEDEMACIEAFHGNTFRVYKKVDGKFTCIHELDDHSDFYHVVWGGKLAGENVFIGGCRRGSQALFVLAMRDGRMEYRLVEGGVGPSNATVLHATAENAHITGGRDMILSANREIAEAAVYYVENE